MSQLIPVRKGEELNLTNLEKYLRREIPDLPKGSLEIKQFGTGASNLTYAIKLGEWEAVLRRPPFGPVAPKAHDMEREYQLLSALHLHFPKAPKPYLFCGDKAIVGKPFFIMERKHGALLDTSFPKEIEATEANCKRVSELMVDTMVDLHKVPYKSTFLEKISKPDGFMERQVHGWIQRYERSKTEEIKEVELLTKWLTSHIPESQEPTVIHYDFKLNNTLFSNDLTEVTGLFDWEMSTVGDPLADLGAAMSYWMEDSDPPLIKSNFRKPPVTIMNGFYTRREFVEAYSKKTGRDVSNIHFYITFAYFKLAVICQQIYYRYYKGQTNDERFSQMNHFVKALIQHSLSTAHEGWEK
jgi:aminoglycoside phosphotransferase (APT) family kinase protein